MLWKQQQQVGELTTEQRRQKGRLGGEAGWVSTHSCGQLSVKDVTGGISQKPSPPLQVTAIRIQDTEDAWGLEQVFSPTSRQQQEQRLKKKRISPEYVVVLLPVYHSVTKFKRSRNCSQKGSFFAYDDLRNPNSFKIIKLKVNKITHFGIFKPGQEP